MITIHVDGADYQVDEKENLLHGCLSVGLNLPYFCWHPALGSVGACRQCAVKSFRDEKDTKGRIVMACMTPPTPGMRISIDDPDVVEFRRSVIEGLMESHPHDCPVCDEGGECHLQDMTVMSGHVYRRYRFAKRTFRNQYLGPFVNQEMNRCIQCYRCVRFYRDYAGGRDFEAQGLRNVVFFGRSEEGVLESEFSGNLVEVCPTGVFTDATLKHHYTRKWDLTMAPSICVHCATGCNITPGERYGVLRRIVNRYNGEVNGYFICDRGRYGYEHVNSPRRIRRAAAGAGEARRAIAPEDAIARLTQAVRAGGRVLGIGSPRASLESNFALREIAGAGNFCSGMSAREDELVALMIDIMKHGPARPASLKDAGQADAVFVLGEDVANTAPRLALALRQAVRQKPLEAADALKIARWLDQPVRELLQDRKGPFHVAAPYATRLDDVATTAARGAPADIALLGNAVAAALDAAAPPVRELSRDTREMAARIAADLRAAAKPLVVSGAGCGDAGVIAAAGNVARALKRAGRDVSIAFAFPECNSCGVSLLGGGLTLDQAFRAARDQPGTVVIILENDLYRRAPAAAVDEFLARAGQVIVLDHLHNRTVERADLVLPAAAFAEADGTLVSSEGRAQRSLQVFVPEGDIRESWRWLGLDRERNLDYWIEVMCDAVPAIAAARDAAPASVFRKAGMKIGREPHRYSGRTAITANLNVSEPKPPVDPDTPLTFTMEGYPAQPPAPLIPYFWSPGWNSIQSVNKFQAEIAGPLKGGDPGIRLIEPSGKPEDAYHSASAAPRAAVAPEEGGWLVLPLHHIFGSEELSAASPPIAELAPKPYIAINAGDAERLGIRVGDPVQVTFPAETGPPESFTLSAVVRHDLPAGVAGLPVGLDGLTGLSLPAHARIARVP